MGKRPPIPDHCPEHSLMRICRRADGVPDTHVPTCRYTAEMTTCWRRRLFGPMRTRGSRRISDTPAEEMKEIIGRSMVGEHPRSKVAK
jgi:hypothetical protein